jgi:hypothetical protein
LCRGHAAVCADDLVGGCLIDTDACQIGHLMDHREREHGRRDDAVDIRSSRQIPNLLADRRSQPPQH